MRPSAAGPAPQRPATAPQPPRPAMQPASPVPAPAAAGSSTAGPTVCPKCSGNLINMSGKFVCEKCFHSVDITDAAPNPTQNVQPPVAPAPRPAPVAPAPQGPAPAPIPAPAVPAASLCPKCSGNLVTIGGKSVCEKCFHTVDDAPAAPGAPAPTAPAPIARPAAPIAPLASAAASPSMSAPSSSMSGTVCPKCSGTLMDISGKLVCEQCYHVVDSPSGSPAAKSASPFAKPAAPAFVPPSVCPKCSGSLMDVGGKYVCDACYHVVDAPGSPLIPTGSGISSGFTPRPRPTETDDDAAMSPAVMGGGALILLLILMIVVLAIRH